MNEYNDFDGEIPGEYEQRERMVNEIMEREDMEFANLDHDILAMGQNGNQTVVVVTSTAVAGTQLFKTFDKNRVVVVINTRQLEDLMHSSPKEAVSFVQGAVNVGAYHFGWK